MFNPLRLAHDTLAAAERQAESARLAWHTNFSSQALALVYAAFADAAATLRLQYEDLALNAMATANAPPGASPSR